MDKKDAPDISYQVETYIILLLGAKDEQPLPSRLHLQKELFMLSKARPVINDIFRFEKHYEGPYSQILNESLDEPAYWPNAYTSDESGIHLTAEGKEKFTHIVPELGDTARFKALLGVLRLIRSLYDNLSKDELLLLIYDEYEEYIEKSKEYDRINKNRRVLSNNLRKKGSITQGRYDELMTRNNA
jgi:hypothetical protein